MSEFINGAALDTRPTEAKLKDFNQKEVVANAATVQWREKQPSEYRRFPIFNQNGSGSCVAQTEAKELGIMRWLKDGQYVHFSATDIYQQRFNKPDAGMGAIDAREIVRKGGATLEVLTPSQSMTDAQMDTAVVEGYKRDVGGVFKVSNYLGLDAANIESVASTIQATGKGVMVWFYFDINEWTDRPMIKNPNLQLNAPSTNRHSVCAVDSTLVSGQKALVIEDSWGPGAGMGGQRIIDETFFLKRNWYAGYLANFKFDTVTLPKPHHIFLRDLQFSPVYIIDSEVTMLQECLRYEGLFPSNAQSTGYFGSITRKAVEDFQVKYSITTPQSPGFGRVGPKTRAVLNGIYGVD